MVSVPWFSVHRWDKARPKYAPSPLGPLAWWEQPGLGREVAPVWGWHVQPQSTGRLQVVVTVCSVVIFGLSQASQKYYWCWTPATYTAGSWTTLPLGPHLSFWGLCSWCVLHLLPEHSPTGPTLWGLERRHHLQIQVACWVHPKSLPAFRARTTQAPRYILHLCPGAPLTCTPACGRRPH